MLLYPKALEKLINELQKLPTIGNKTAARLAVNLISRQTNLLGTLAQALMDAERELRLCAKCFSISQEELCPICQAADREKHFLTIVQFPQNVFHIESSGVYKGLYHVLHGVISPIEGVSPDHLKIKELVERLTDEEFDEVIIALNPTVEGEATAQYLHHLLRNKVKRITRPAVGVPAGSDLEFIDSRTIAGAFFSRNQLT